MQKNSMEVLKLNRTKREVISVWPASSERKPYKALVKITFGESISLFPLSLMEDNKTVLRDVLARLQDDYDYILIDCMPSLGMLTLNAFTAADEVLVPVQPQRFAVEGLQELLKTVEKVRRSSNSELKVSGIIFSLDSKVRSNERMYKDAVRESYGNNIRIFDQTIPNYSKIAEAPNEGHSVLWYEPQGIPANIYQSIMRFGRLRQSTPWSA